MKRLALSALTLLSLAATPPTTAPAPSSALLDLANALPAPAPVGSDELNAELNLVLALQAARTPEQTARATDENLLSMASFAPALGQNFTPEKLPKTAAFLNQLDLLTNAANNALKQLFNRPRPADADPHHRLKPLFAETDPGYPSGHAARAYMLALVLADLLPDHREKLIARGQQLGFDRLLAGMHFPSDITAGRTLAARLHQTLLANPNFRTDLEAARKELQSALLTP
jgi:acid phosphatase (class A)